jgi:prepilin-type N-terminal cleavage/methylation domain-containing protein
VIAETSLPATGRPQKRGFTLIELLVVVSVLALLIGILLPSISRARHLAQRAVCLAHLRQIGTAALAYAADNDFMIPRGEGGSEEDYWYVRFLPYLSSEESLDRIEDAAVYRCPSFPHALNPTTEEWVVQPVSYVSNAWTFPYPPSSTNMGGQRMDPSPLRSFQRPAQTIYLADSEDGAWRMHSEVEEGEVDFAPWRNYMDVWSNSHLSNSTNETAGSAGRRVARDRHLGGFSAAYLDSHAEWTPVDWGNTSSEYTEKLRNMWRDNWGD